MELWFMAAIAGAALTGLSNFFFKVAASRSYNSELFTLYGGLGSIILTGLVAWLSHYSLFQFNFFIAIMIVAGMIASCGGIMKVYALRHIDSTIFFPLFKLLAPGLAIVFGVVWFAESFILIEWVGMLLGLTVPLLLITKAENGRQINLKAGLLFVLLTALTSAASAALNKFAMDAELSVLVGLFYSSLGVFIGSIFIIIFKNGPLNIFHHIKTGADINLIWYATMRTIFICLGFGLILYAYAEGGTLGIVQTIQSMYILVPIILSIIFYNEHWNLQKAAAIVLSVMSLILLG